MKIIQFSVPVLMIIYKRPDTTARVFQAIRAAKPAFLYIAADGPANNSVKEIEACTETRKIVAGIDWDCKVKTLFRDENLGCKLGASGAVDWFFENEEEGIILEDDCLPHPDFFPFCREILDRYRSDRRVTMITGSNFHFGKKTSKYSYYFSRYPVLWGWASWRRAWKLYDVNMPLWPIVAEEKILHDIFETSVEAAYWEKPCRLVYDRKIDTWDYQWNLVNWLNNALTVTPNVNLISNIGFANNASHTHKINKYAALPVEGMDFPLSHPPYVARNCTADKLVFKNHYYSSLIKRVKNKLKLILKNNISLLRGK